MYQEICVVECFQNGPKPSLSTTAILPVPTSCALPTFPDDFGLCITSLPLPGYGGFARKSIPMGELIGPYTGKKISVEEGMKQFSQGHAPFLKGVSN